MSGPIQLINLALSLVAFGLIAHWYVMPRLKAMPRASAMKPLLLLHTFRHIGLMFLATGATHAPLASQFARPAAYGDLAASLLAFLALSATHKRWRVAVPLIWVFNIEGTVDLLLAVTLGVWHDAAAGMGATFWIPSVVVPSLLVTHAMIFVLLARGAGAAMTSRAITEAEPAGVS